MGKAVPVKGRLPWKGQDTSVAEWGMREEGDALHQGFFVLNLCQNALDGQELSPGPLH